MADATHLRDVAARMFALSMQVEDQELAAHLALRASDYLTQAEELEHEAAAAQKPEKDIEPA
jgi:hypothetical protein